MKTAITILIFLLQALFISAKAMNEILVTDDSSSEEKSFIVLLDGSELIGKILSQNSDSLNIRDDNGENKVLSIKQVCCLVNLLSMNAPDYYNYDNSNYRFFLSDKIVKYGTIIDSVSSIYSISFDDSVTVDIMKKDIINKYPCYEIKDIQWFNEKNRKYLKVFLKDEDSISGLLLSNVNNIMKLVSNSKYLVLLPREFIEGEITLTRISDTTDILIPAQRIIMINNRAITGNIIYETNDSIAVKIEPGTAVILPKEEVSAVEEVSVLYDYYKNAKNVFYIDMNTLNTEKRINNVSINYEVLIFPYLGFRLGYVYSYYPDLGDINVNSVTRGNGINFSINLIPGLTSRFEFDLGLSYYRIEYTPILEYGSFWLFKYFEYNYYTLKYDPHESLEPLISVGYRYQPKYGGFVLRIGINLNLINAGFYASLGCSF